MRDTAILGSSPADPAQTVVLAPRGLKEASRPVAGVTHLARALIAAERAGARRAMVLLADAPGLKAQVREELGRAGAAIEVDWSAPGAGAPQGAVGLGDLRRLRRQVLLATAKPSDGLVSRWLNRPVSRFITARILAIPGARPWHLTLVTAAIAVLMFAGLASGAPRGVVIGALLFHLASVVDGVDGEMARATFRTSRLGAILDTSVDMATNLLFTLGVTIGLSRHGGHQFVLIGGLAFTFHLTGVLLLGLLVRSTRFGPSFDLLKSLYVQHFSSGWKGRVATAIRNAYSRDVFAFLFAVLALAGAARAIPWILMISAGVWLVTIAAAPFVMPRTGAGAPAPANQP